MDRYKITQVIQQILPGAEVRGTELDMGEVYCVWVYTTEDFISPLHLLDIQDSLDAKGAVIYSINARNPNSLGFLLRISF